MVVRPNSSTSLVIAEKVVAAKLARWIDARSIQLVNNTGWKRAKMSLEEVPGSAVSAGNLSRSGLRSFTKAIRGTAVL